MRQHGPLAYVRHVAQHVVAQLRQGSGERGWQSEGHAVLRRSRRMVMPEGARRTHNRRERWRWPAMRCK